jgi:polysaccharide pyruvyl transferase WcaK-like protein
MNQVPEHEFVGIGNVPYHNRGCEAIVQGTMRVLRHGFGGNVRLAAGSYVGTAEHREQLERERDGAVSHFRMEHGPKRFSGAWVQDKANRLLGTRLPAHRAGLERRLRGPTAVLSLGGDIYSLDYGLPRGLMADDAFVLERGLPLVLWGASVGPFDAHPEFAREMFAHLRRFTCVFVREERSLAYLRANGLEENVRLVADPAFLMEPERPDAARLGFSVPEEAIGVNLSPLIGRYFSDIRKEAWLIDEDDLRPWEEACAQMLRALVRSTGRPVVLVPHVIHSLTAVDDHAFLERVLERMRGEGVEEVQLLPRGLNAMEIKGVIGACAVFAGARTHSTIAAFSTHTPTVSISYSVKARGINEDVFGHADFCVSSKEVNAERFTGKVTEVLAQREALGEQLRGRIPAVRERALKAGEYLAELVGGGVDAP